MDGWMDEGTRGRHRGHSRWDVSKTPSPNLTRDPAQVRSTFLLVAGLSVAAILCLAVCGIAAWGRFVRGLSWTDMRKGHWEPPEEEGWRSGATARNMLPTARFESWQRNERSY